MKTILLTGITGYIAKHIAIQLLNAGYSVRGSMRSMNSVQVVNGAVASGLDDPNALTRLSFCQLDLTKDSGWTDAAQGVDAVIHTASPFPMSPPKTEDELIRPAVDGMLRALKAAHTAGVKRVIVTSSTAAVTESDLGEGKSAFDESNWSNTGSPTISAYSKSKTLAERAAWKFVEDEAPDMQLTSINPGFVAGPPLGQDFGTSVAIIERLLKAKDPMLPNFGFSAVDVRDVAELHVKALTNKASIGQRVLGVDQFVRFVDMAKDIQKAFPNRKIRTRVAPNALVKILGLFDASIRLIVPSLGKTQKVDNSRARVLLGRDLRNARESVVETARDLIEKGVV